MRADKKLPNGEYYFKGKLVLIENDLIKVSVDVKDQILRVKDIEEYDLNRIRIQAYIEIKAVEETLLEKELTKIQGWLEKEKDFTIK